MKKIRFFGLPLIVLGALIFFNCKAKGASSGSRLPSIGVAIYKYSDTFMSYTRNAIEQNARGKAVIIPADSQNSQLTQNDQVDQFIAQKVKSLAINPVDRTAAGTIIDKARAGKVPIVFFNREPLADDMQKWDQVYYVGAKAEESGTMQGEIIAEYWKAHPEMDANNDGVLQYVMLKGEPGHQDAEMRTEYSIKAVTDAGIKVEELAVEAARWDRPMAVEKMEGFLARFGGKIEAVFCNNDDMALGAIDALRKAGFFTSGKYLPVVGVDATAPALQAVADGTLLGTVLNDAKSQGKATFDIAYALATDASPANSGWKITDGKYIWVPYQKVTRDNYTDFME